MCMRHRKYRRTYGWKRTELRVQCNSAITRCVYFWFVCSLMLFSLYFRSSILYSNASSPSPCSSLHPSLSSSVNLFLQMTFFVSVVTLREPAPSLICRRNPSPPLFPWLGRDTTASATTAELFARARLYRPISINEPLLMSHFPSKDPVESCAVKRV